MNDEQFITSIGQMSTEDVFRLILENPEYLTDSYYGDFGRAIRGRIETLLEEKRNGTVEI